MFNGLQQLLLSDDITWTNLPVFPFPEGRCQRGLWRSFSRLRCPRGSGGGGGGEEAGSALVSSAAAAQGPHCGVRSDGGRPVTQTPSHAETKRK